MTNDNEPGVSKATPDEMMSDADRQAQAINRQNEAEATNQMVDAGLLTPKQAEDFNFEEEFKIPEALLSEPPKISEQLRTYILTKFPESNFSPSKIEGALIHGTNLRAIRPLYLGESKKRTGYTGIASKDESWFENAKGIFSIVGDLTRLDKNGFNHITENGKRSPGVFGVDFPIYLVVGYDPGRGERIEDVEADRLLSLFSRPDSGTNLHERYSKGIKNIQAIILAKPEKISMRETLTQSERCLRMLDDTDQKLFEVYKILPEKAKSLVFDTISPKVRQYSFPEEIEQQKRITEEFTEYLSQAEEALIKEKPMAWSDYYNERLKGLKSEIAELNQLCTNGNYSDIQKLPQYSSFKNEYVWDKELTKEIMENILSKEIDTNKKMLSRRHGEDIYKTNDFHSEKDLYLSIEQEKNYIAHCMVQGVDKSKIVPIYDWDGNLLWPKDSDTNDSVEHENEDE